MLPLQLEGETPRVFKGNQARYGRAARSVIDWRCVGLVSIKRAK